MHTEKDRDSDRERCRQRDRETQTDRGRDTDRASTERAMQQGQAQWTGHNPDADTRMQPHF